MTTEGTRALVLWDVDHTLIENGGVSKENYALAFLLLTDRPVEEQPPTDGRTDIDIMANLFEANGLEAPDNPEALWSALMGAARRNEDALQERGHALDGAADCLERLAAMPDVINSVLTGNIEANARVKLGAFGLDKWIDFSVGGFGSEHRVRSQLVPIAQYKAAERFNFDPTSDVTVLVGDTQRDVQAGLDGGARVVAVATGMDSQKQLVEAGADVVLPSLADVDAFLVALERVRALGPLAASG